MPRVYFIAILFFLAAFDSFGQVTLRGRILFSEDKTPLPGVTVFVKGTTAGTLTNPDGEFSFGSPVSKGTLIVRFLGFVTQEIPFSPQLLNQGNDSIKIEMVFDDTVMTTTFGCYMPMDFITLAPSYGLNYLGYGFKIKVRIPPVFDLYPRLRLEADYNARASNSRKYFRASRYSNYIASGVNVNFDLEYASRRVIISDQNQGLEELGLVTSLYSRQGTFGIGLGLNRASESSGKKDFALILEYFKEISYSISIKTQIKKWHEHTQLRWQLNYEIYRVNLNLGIKGEHLKQYNEFMLYLAYEIRR